MSSADGRLVVKGFPAGLHQRLRVLAARQQTTVKEILIAAAEAEVRSRERELDGEAGVGVWAPGMPVPFGGQ